jgi:hypothetical protein
MLVRSSRDLRDTTNKLYLTILQRLPTEAELAAIKAYPGSGKVKSPEDLIDVSWALINSPEFLYRH